MNKERSSFRSLSLVFAAIGCWAILAFGNVPLGAAPAPPWTPDPGPWTVAKESLTLVDSERGKDLPVTVLYPETAEASDAEAPARWPVIVFSHGAGGNGAHEFPLTRHWASHGYVVLQPSHADADALARMMRERQLRQRQGQVRRGNGLGRGGQPRGGLGRGGLGGGARQGAPTAQRPGRAEAGGALREALHELVGDPEAWDNRADDVHFLLDQLDNLGRQVPALAGRLDAERVGVSGHSFGAYTAQLVGGATVIAEEGGEAVSFADPRPQAFILLSGQGAGQEPWGLHEASWTAFDRPLMAVTGSHDGWLDQGVPQGRLDPYRHAAAGDKWALFLEGAVHASFTGRLVDEGEAPRSGRRGPTVLLSRESPEEEQTIFQAVRVATLAFWDATLRGDGDARRALDSEAFRAWTDGMARLEGR